MMEYCANVQTLTESDRTYHRVRVFDSILVYPSDRLASLRRNLELGLLVLVGPADEVVAVGVCVSV